MGSSSGQDCYVLKWNEFHFNVCNSFADLREEEDFYDVTIAVDEEHQLQAHKVILSASSPYFRSLLKRNPAQHPVLVMPPQVRFQELVALIDFIYQGEVKIPGDDLTEFMGLAEMLKVRGLTEDKEPKKAPQPQQQPPSQQQKNMPRLPPGTQVIRRRSATQQPQNPQPPQASSPGQAKRPRMSNYPKMKPIDTRPQVEAEEVAQVSSQGGQGDDLNEDVPDDFFPDDYGYNQQPFVEPQPETSPAAAGLQLTGLLCPHCRLMCYGVEALKEHMFTVHGMRAPTTGGQTSKVTKKAATASANQDGQQYTCNICDKSFKNRRYIQAHQKRVHKVGCEMEEAYQEQQEQVISQGSASGSKEGMPSSSSKKRGRPRKKLDMAAASEEIEQEEANLGGSEEYYDAQVAAANANKPIGQVQPRPHAAAMGEARPSSQGSSSSVDVVRGLSQGQHRPKMSTIASPGPSVPRKSMPPGVGRGRPPGPMHGMQQQGMDIKKLGMKLGGNISITSSETAPPRRSMAPMGPCAVSSPQAVTMEQHQQGVSITKMKGDQPVSSPMNIKDAARPPIASTSTSRIQLQEQPQHVEVKEEPMDEYEEGEEEEEEEEEEDLPDDYEEGQYDNEYGDSYGDMASGSLDGMYRDEEPFEDGEEGE